MEDDNGSIIEKSYSYNDRPITAISGDCAYTYIIAHWVVVPSAPVCLRCYKRSFLERNQLVFPHGRLHEDEEFTPRAFYYAQTVVFTTYAGYCYRQRQNSIMSTISAKNIEHVVQNIEDLCDFFVTKKCNTPHMAQAFLYPLIGIFNVWICFEKYDAEMRKLARKLIIQKQLAKRIKALPMYAHASLSLKARLFVGEITCYLPFLRWPLIVAFKVVNFLRK